MPLPAIVTMFMALEWVPYSYLLQCILHMIPMYFKCKSGNAILSEIFNGFVPVSILVGRKDASKGKLGSAIKGHLQNCCGQGEGRPTRAGGAPPVSQQWAHHQ